MGAKFNDFGDRMEEDSDSDVASNSAHMEEEANVFGDAEILVEEEDLIPIETPLISGNVETNTLDFLASRNFEISDLHYLSFLTTHRPQAVALVGPHMAGKTSLANFLMSLSEFPVQSGDSAVFDCTADERHRRMTLSAHSALGVFGGIAGKSVPVSIVDLPGHPAFAAETRTGICLADSLVLVVDVIAGIDPVTAAFIKELGEKRPLQLVISKIDRLAIELRVGPEDAFAIIRERIDQVNETLFSNKNMYFSPLKGNVLFASAKLNLLFSLESWASSALGGQIKAPAACLWGDCFFNKETSEITKGAVSWTAVPTFAALVLEPLWKIITASACSTNFAKWARKFLDFQVAPSAELNAAQLFAKLFAASSSSCWLSEGLRVVKEDQDCVLLITPAHRHDFRLCRVLQGVLKSRTPCALRGMDGGDTEIEVEGLDISLVMHHGRVPGIAQATEGMVVLISGSQAIEAIQPGVYACTGAQVPECFRDNADEISRSQFRSRQEAVVCLDVETNNMEKLQEALRKVQSIRPGVVFKLLEISSGEISACRIFGSQELQLDQSLRELRRFETALKVADPSVLFSETVADTSADLIAGVTANKKLKIELFAEPLDAAVAEYLRSLSDSEIFCEEELHARGLDWLSIKSIVACKHGNLLIDETAGSPSLDEVSPLTAHKHAIVSGFEWAIGEGPLISERVRGVKFRVVSVSRDAARVPVGQVVPLVRRLCHEALLNALPRIMEPVFLVTVLLASDKLAPMVATVLSKRRGSVESQTAKPGTPFVEICGRLPALEAFGFETDLRMASGNMAVISCRFCGERVVPGDPTDATIPIRALAVVPSVWLARDVFVKVRRQKRLNL